MTDATRDLLKRALELPEKERAALVRELTASLEGAGESSDEVDVDPEFAAELERRIRDLEEGRVKPVSFGQLIEEARARLDAGGKHPTS